MFDDDKGNREEPWDQEEAESSLGTAVVTWMAAVVLFAACLYILVKYA